MLDASVPICALLASLLLKAAAMRFMRMAIPLALLLVSLHVLGCGSQEDDLLWIADECGRFHTTDLDRAQNEVPFPIVVPSYLPPNVEGDAWVVGPLRDAWPDNEVMIEISYQAVGGVEDGLMTIYECNCILLGPDAASTPGLVESAIAESEVLEWRHVLALLGPDGPIDIPGNIFMWNRSDVHFRVEVYGYRHNEAVKIIESMIQSY